jgi:hypothetical protein
MYPALGPQRLDQPARLERNAFALILNEEEIMISNGMPIFCLIIENLLVLSL